MRLLFTDKSFIKDGVVREGVPFLADSEANLVTAANRYLFYISCIKGTTRSENTWITYADHLYEYFSFIEENSLNWKTAGDALLATWRDGMSARGLMVNTINSRLRTVIKFYDWCNKRGLVDMDDFEVREVRASMSDDFLAHVDASGGIVEASDLTLPCTEPLPKFLVNSQVVKFIGALSPRRTRLVAWVMRLAGLRREEAGGLDVRVLPSPAGYGPKQRIRMNLDPRLTPTKGNVERTVYLPYQLAGCLHDYLMDERPALAKLYKKKYGRETTKLFLTKFGEELSLDGIDDQFRIASRKSGVDCHPHILRHSFAVYELIYMSGKPKVNALLWVRDRLGHASVKTTERYLKGAALIQHGDMDEYVDDILGAMAGSLAK